MSANKLSVNPNIIARIARNFTAIVAVGALALGLSGCDNTSATGPENGSVGNVATSAPGSNGSTTETTPRKKPTVKSTIDISGIPKCDDLVRQQGVKTPSELKDFARYGDDINGDGMEDPIKYGEGGKAEILCI